MQSERNFLDELKHQYASGGMYIRLIFINVLVFLVIGILNTIANLAELDQLRYFLTLIFTLNTDFYDFLYQPWGLFTSIFSHFNILHLLMNMLFLFFAGKYFEHFFGAKRLLAIYLLGGIVGGLFEIIAHASIPVIASQANVIVGASGSIMAIFIGLAFYRPNLKVSLFGVLEIRIIFIALFYIAFDLLSLGLNDGTAHFAHLGGSLIGLIAAQQPDSSRNLIYRFEKLLGSFSSFFTSFKGSKQKRQTESERRRKTDEEYNLDKKKRQEKIDVILDKISKSGYESLTKAEKEFLFKQSNNG